VVLLLLLLLFDDCYHCRARAAVEELLVAEELERLLSEYVVASFSFVFTTLHLLLQLLPAGQGPPEESLVAEELERHSHLTAPDSSCLMHSFCFTPLPCTAAVVIAFCRA
jgi:hypothetical protein